MSGFQISGLQDDEPFDDIPSNLVSGYQNLGLQSNYSPAAPAVSESSRPVQYSTTQHAPAQPRAPVNFPLSQILACETLTYVVSSAVHLCTFAILRRGL